MEIGFGQYGFGGHTRRQYPGVAGARAKKAETAFVPPEGFKKYEPIRNPLEVERAKKKMTPNRLWAARYEEKAILQRLEELDQDAGSDVRKKGNESLAKLKDKFDKSKSLARAQVYQNRKIIADYKSEKQLLIHQAHAQYIQEFICWLQGKSAWNEPKLTPWGFHPLVGDSIKKYVKDFAMKKADYVLELQKLKADPLPPVDIDTAWIYWKYLVSPYDPRDLPAEYEYLSGIDDDYLPDMDYWIRMQQTPNYRDQLSRVPNTVRGSGLLDNLSVREGPQAGGDPGEATCAQRTRGGEIRIATEKELLDATDHPDAHELEHENDDFDSDFEYHSAGESSDSDSGKEEAAEERHFPDTYEGQISAYADLYANWTRLRAMTDKQFGRVTDNMMRIARRSNNNNAVAVTKENIEDLRIARAHAKSVNNLEKLKKRDQIFAAVLKGDPEIPASTREGMKEATVLANVTSAFALRRRVDNLIGTKTGTLSVNEPTLAPYKAPQSALPPPSAGPQPPPPLLEPSQPPPPRQHAKKIRPKPSSAIVPVGHVFSPESSSESSSSGAPPTPEKGREIPEEEMRTIVGGMWNRFALEGKKFNAKAFFEAGSPYSEHELMQIQNKYDEAKETFRTVPYLKGVAKKVHKLRSEDKPVPESLFHLVVNPFEREYVERHVKQLAEQEKSSSSKRKHFTQEDPEKTERKEELLAKMDKHFPIRDREWAGFSDEEILEIIKEGKDKARERIIAARVHRWKEGEGLPPNGRDLELFSEKELEEIEEAISAITGPSIEAKSKRTTKKS